MENNENQAVVNQSNLPKRTSVLVFGILSVSFLCTFWLSFLSIIFGFIARGKSNAFLDAGQPVSGKVKVGRILGTVGGIVGIVFTVLAPIIIAAYVILIVQLVEDPTVQNGLVEFFKALGITIA